MQQTDENIDSGSYTQQFLEQLAGGATWRMPQHRYDELRLMCIIILTHWSLEAIL
jgi:hypothetical protein